MEAEFPSGSHEVCPRCGTPPGEGVWCERCGLNLKQQKELPTADAYSARVREERWLKSQEAEKQSAAQERRAGTAIERDQRKRERAEKAKARRQELVQRRVQRRGRLRQTLKVAGLATLAVLGMLAVAAAAWHFTGWDAPLLGVSPLRDEDESSSAGEATAAAATEAASEAPCDPVVITPNTDDVISNIAVAGISCDEASKVLSEWGSSGYPGEGPDGFTCDEAGRDPNPAEGNSTGLRCRSGGQVIIFGGAQPSESTAPDIPERQGEACEEADDTIVDLSSNALPCEAALDVALEFLSSPPPEIGSLDASGQPGEPLSSGFVCTPGPAGSAGTAPVSCAGEAGSAVEFAVALPLE